MSTIAAISTPNASGGIGVIRISGEDAPAVADRCFRAVSGKKLSEMKGYTAAYGYIHDGEIRIDDCVALVFKCPKSYTGEDVVELSCHGGLFVTQQALRTVLKCGAQPAEAGEFTKRAFLNGKMDLAEAEAVMNIISAQGQQALNAAVNTLQGKLSRRLGEITAKLSRVSAAIAVWIDNPDEDIEEAHEENVQNDIEASVNELKMLINEFDNGQVAASGVRTAICGHPNVGKSTLMNLLTGYERSIVTSVAGTTRDVIEETVRVGDIVLRLADTAGIRESADEVESIGINLAYEKLRQSDLILAVFDGSEPLTNGDIQLLAECKGKRAVAVINKSDLPRKSDENEINKYIPISVSISAATGEGRDELSAALERILGSSEIDSSRGMLVNERQRLCCLKALESLKEGSEALKMGVTLDAVNVNVDYAVEQLLELTGKKARETVVNEIFANFCVGK